MGGKGTYYAEVKNAKERATYVQFNFVMPAPLWD